jgi:glycerol-3-phosphate dehydrogenase (NAD(P)+)
VHAKLWDYPVLGFLLERAGAIPVRPRADAGGTADNTAALDELDAVLAEGAFTASALVQMARKKNVEMPIAEAVDDVLAGRLDIDSAIARLLSSPFGEEV